MCAMKASAPISIRTRTKAMSTSMSGLPRSWIVAMSWRRPSPTKLHSTVLTWRKKFMAVSPSTDAVEGETAMNFLRQVKTVLWSFVGLGRRQDMATIHERGNPLMLVLIAFVLVLMLMGALAFIAHMAVRV